MKVTRLNINRKFKGVEYYNEGELIEETVRRCTTSKEPIDSSREIIFTKKKDGVIPGYNIRADRWDIAIDAMDVYNKERVSRNLEKKSWANEKEMPDGVGDGTSQQEQN